jgi:mono/diheme cytochrome c family protein
MSEESQPNPDVNNSEPTSVRSTVPTWIFVVMLLCAFLGLVFYDRHSGWFDAHVYGPYGTAEEVEAYQPKSGADALRLHGKAVFEMYCGSCHGNDGMGKPNQAPPLAGSEWVNTKGFNRVTAIPLEGLSGPFQVACKDWNLVMAPMGAALPDADLAAVMTYIRSGWGNKGEEVTADDVKAIRAKLGAHPQPIAADQLKNLPE